MLLIPLIGAAFHDLLMDKLKAGEKNFSGGEEFILKRVNIEDWAKSLKISNCDIAKLSEMEFVINKFVIRFSDLVAASKQAGDNPDLLVTSWRSLFEVSVVFRVLCQSLIQNSNMHEFQELLERFKDYGIMTSDNVFNAMKVEEKYKDAKRNRKMIGEYDWLNPIFPDQVAKRFSKPFSPSFRDLVARTKESDPELVSFIPLYEKASNALHFNFLSNKIISEIDVDELKSSVDLVGRIFLFDYLRMVSKLYSSIGAHNQYSDTIISLSSELSKIIKFQ
jgi:hypothetical protein